MKVLCDVHISFKIVKLLIKNGIDCTHVNNILDGYFTKDSNIIDFVDNENYILITKDKDFKNSFILSKTPKKLIKINLGNLPNDILESRLLILITEYNHLLEMDTFLIEINSDSFIQSYPQQDTI